MTDADISRVAEIHVFAQRKAYRGIFSDDWLFRETTVFSRAEEAGTWFEEEGVEGFVFEDADIIKGFVVISPCPDKGKPHALELERIFVDPLMQGQGIGAKLLEFCEKNAYERDFSEVCLWTLEDNKEARDFYEKRGYAHDGEREHFDDISVTQLRYTKTIMAVKEGFSWQQRKVIDD